MAEDISRKHKRAYGTGEKKEVGKNKWHLKVPRGGTDAQGKRLLPYFETFHGSAKEAEERLSELRRKIKCGEPLKLSQDTFGECIDEWLKAHPDTKKSTIRTYNFILKHIPDKLRNKLLSEIDADVIQSLYQEASRKLKPASVIMLHTLLKSIIKLAMVRRKLFYNPFNGVIPPSSKR